MRSIGFCCNVFASARGICHRGPTCLSGSDPEQRCDEPRLGLDVASTDVPNLPLPDHYHRLVACQRSSSRPEAAKAPPRTGQSFYLPMVLLDDIVLVFHLSQP